MDNEYQEQMKREKEHHEGKMRDMQTEIERLHEDLSEMKVKARQEKSRVKAGFEREREEMEEQFEKEKNEWRRRMNMMTAMQPRDLQRVSTVQKQGTRSFQFNRRKFRVHPQISHVSSRETCSRSFELNHRYLIHRYFKFRVKP